MNGLTVGVIGLGVGAHHVEAYLSHPQVKTCLVTDFDTAKVEAISKRYPGRVQALSCAQDIINNEQVKVVSVASYDNDHASQVLAAISKGKHVFVEKPMCLNVNEAKIIKKALARAKNVKLSSNMVLRTCPLFMDLKDTYLRGDLGNIYSLRADYLWGRMEKLTSGWRKETPGYSIIYGAAVHMIDLVCWILGRFPVEVRAVGNRIATNGTGFVSNDYAAMFLTFEDGLVMEVTAHGGCVHSHFHQMEVWGTKKTFIHHLENSYWLENQNGSVLRTDAKGDYPAKSHRGKVSVSFLDSCLDQKDCALVSSDDVFKTMSVCFAAEESMKTGKGIRIKFI